MFLARDHIALTGTTQAFIVFPVDENGLVLPVATTAGQSTGNSSLAVIAALKDLLAPTGQTTLGSTLAGTTWDAATAITLPLGTEWIYVTPTEATMFFVNTTGSSATASDCADLTADQSHQFRAPSSTGTTGYLHYKAPVTGGTFRVTALGNY